MYPPRTSVTGAGSRVERFALVNTADILGSTLSGPNLRAAWPA